MKSSESKKNVPRGNTIEITKLKRNLKVTEYLRGGTMQRRHKETELLNTL
jgi:hypothetical protein